MKVLLFFILLPTLFFLSCSSESKDLVFTTPEIILQADGPLLEGANTAQGNFKSTLAEFLKTTGTSLDKVSEATLIGVTLILPDSMNSSLLSEITLQLAADNVDMQKVGVLNPVPEGQTRLTLNIAKEQEKIGKILQQTDITFVADVNIKKDTASSLPIKGIFEFKITVK
jgi:hypothetical protein